MNPLILLCKLGFHKWEYVGKDPFNNNFFICNRCIECKYENLRGTNNSSHGMIKILKNKGIVK